LIRLKNGKDFLKYGFDSFRYHTYSSELESRGLLDPTTGKCNELFPCGEDGLCLEAVIHKFVSNYLDLHYNEGDRNVTNDPQLDSFWKNLQQRFNNEHFKQSGFPIEFNLKNLKEVLTQFIFRVTGGHSQAGDANATALDPSVVNLRISHYDKSNPDRTLVAPFEASAVQCAVTALTALPKPKLITDVSYFYSHSKSREVYNQFLRELIELSCEIDQRNRIRMAKGEWPLEDYNPRYCNISTAV